MAKGFVLDDERSPFGVRKEYFCKSLEISVLFEHKIKASDFGPCVRSLGACLMCSTTALRVGLQLFVVCYVIVLLFPGCTPPKRMFAVCGCCELTLADD